MPAEFQDELFPGFAPSPETRIHLQRADRKPLTKRQKQFNRELRKLEKLREEYAQMEAQWEQFLRTYMRDLRPAELELNRHRIAFVEILGEAWRGRNRLGRRQRETLASILHRELGVVAQVQPELQGSHPTLDALAEALEKAREAELRRAHAAFQNEMSALDPDEAEEIEEMMVDYIEELGFDSDRFSAAMSPEDFAAEMERQMRDGPSFDEDEDEDENVDVDEDADPRPGARKRKQTAAQKRAAAQVAERVKARQRTLSTIYKQLAKAIHPDREQDPVRRAEKLRVMQELTAAHRDRDLHTLLRLELEWLEGENDHLEALTDEKLAIYLEVLREQVHEINESLLSISHEPRFQAVAHFVGAWTIAPRDPREILAELQVEIDILSQTRDHLQGKESKTVLRKIITREQERQRREERSYSLFDPFG